MTEKDNKPIIKLKKFDTTILDGLFMKNPLFADGLIVAPAVVMAYTVRNSLALCFVFSMVTFFTLLISSFVPRSMVYTMRIILYTFIASCVYIPTLLAAEALFQEEIAAIGVFIPLLVTNSLIVSKSEQRFFLKTKGRMILDILCFVVGYDIALLIMGLLRELISTGAIGDRIYGVIFTCPAIALPFGGFIFLAFAAALVRRIQIAVMTRKGVK